MWLAYDAYKLKQVNGAAINWDDGGDVLKIALVKSTYTPSRSGHDFWNDVSAHEVSGSNYTAGGETLAGRVLAVVSNVLNFDCDNVEFLQHAAGFTDARYAVLYHSTGVSSTSPLIASYDLGTDRGNVAGDLVLQTPDGIFNTSG